MRAVPTYVTWNSNSNRHNNVYSVVTVIVRMHRDHFMNAEQCQADADLWTKSTDFDHKTSPTVIYYYSAQKLTFIKPSH